MLLYIIMLSTVVEHTLHMDIFIPETSPPLSPSATHKVMGYCLLHAWLISIASTPE